MKVSLGGVRGHGALLGGTLPLLPWVLASKHRHVWLAFHGYIEGPNLQDPMQCALDSVVEGPISS
uniref:Uncharacterized protein n=1 Tax=Triticum urartu TaxID=4572 RepID=A0A8R7Q2F5_TRIUA